MESRRRKGSSFSNLFRRNKDSTKLPLSNEQESIVKPEAKRLETGSERSETASVASHYTHQPPEASLAAQPNAVAPRPVSRLDSPPSYQVEDQSPKTTRAFTNQSLQTPRSVDDQDSPLSVETKVPPYIGGRSSSEPGPIPRAHSDIELPSGKESSGKAQEDHHTKLWDEAYDELKRIEPELITAYEKILTKDYDDESEEAELVRENLIEQDDKLKRQTQMNKILRVVLQKTTKPSGAERKVTEAINVVLSLKKVIDSSLQAVPIAAVAWTGVCIGLQLISNTIAEQEARNKGIVDIALKMKWYTSLSQVILNDANEKLANLRRTLPHGILDFYVNILAYLFKCICASYKGRAQIFKGILNLDGWENMIQATNEKELTFRNAIQDYSDERKISYLELLVDMCRSSAEDDLIHKISVMDMRLELQALQGRKDNLIPESWNWILSNDSFLRFSDWNVENSHRRLWIKGRAGMGKTMLLIGIVEKLERELVTQHETRFDPPYLAYFFCQGTNGKINTATAVIRSLIWMLLRQEHSLIQHAVPLAGTTMDDSMNTFLAVKNVLLAMLKSPLLKRVYIILDALDEVINIDKSDNSPGQEDLLDFVAQLSRDFPNVKCLVSSRDEVDIEVKIYKVKDRNKTALQIELDRKVLAGPIRAYIDKKMSKFEVDYLEKWAAEGDVEDEDRERIHRRLEEVTNEMHRKADGTFLWVALIFLRIVEDKIELRNLPKLVSETPSKLEEIYEKMKQQIQSRQDDSPGLCLDILQVAVTANRPLRLSELRLLATFPEETRPLQFLRQCRFFRVAEDDDGHVTVYMIHQSAKQWLEQQLKNGLLTDLHGPDHLAASHALLARRCLNILRTKLKKNMWNLPGPGSEIRHIRSQPRGSPASTIRTDQDSKESITFAPSPSQDKLVPITYAALNWYDHLSKASTADLIDCFPIVLAFIEDHFLYWLEALSLLRLIGDGAAMMTRLRKFTLDLSLPDLAPEDWEALVATVRDANRFALYFRGIIEHAPLQAYAAGLEFSPINSGVKRLFQHERPPWVTISPIVEDDWSPCLQTVEAHKGAVFCVAFSRDGQRLASASHDKSIRVWAAVTGTLFLNLQGHRDWVSTVAFSHDGKQLASGSHDKTVRIWDAQTGVLLQMLMEHQEMVSSVAFSPRGDRLASGAHDGKIRIYDPRTGVLRRVIAPSTVWVLSVAFSHDGRKIAAGLHDGKVGIWNPETGSQLCQFDSHKNSVSSVLFSPNSTYLASGSHDRTIRIWNIAKKEEQQILQGHKSPVLSMSYDPDGTRLAFGSRDDLVRIWNLSTDSIETTLKGHRNSILSVAFSPGGKRLASSSQDKTVRIWDAETTAAQHASYCHTSPVSALAFSQDGKILASGSFDNGIRVWDGTTGSLIKVLAGHRNSVYYLAFSADGKYLVSASHDKTARTWSTKDWKPHRTLKGHKNSVFAVAFSPDSQIVATGSQDKMVRTWDRDSGMPRHTLTGHSNSVSSVAFSNDGKLLLSGSHDKTVKIWDAENGNLRQTLTCDSSVSAVAFSPDANRVAAGAHDDNVSIWDWESGVMEQIFPIGACPSTISFSEDGDGILTERGFVPFPPDLRAEQVVGRAVYSVLSDRSWITYNGKKLLWIPWEYRHVCLMVRQHTIAIGCASGRVYLLGFSPELSPADVST